jgi:hypothetical protein
VDQGRLNTVFTFLNEFVELKFTRGIQGFIAHTIEFRGGLGVTALYISLQSTSKSYLENYLIRMIE